MDKNYTAAHIGSSRSLSWVTWGTIGPRKVKAEFATRESRRFVFCAHGWVWPAMDAITIKISAAKRESESKCAAENAPTNNAIRPTGTFHVWRPFLHAYIRECRYTLMPNRPLYLSSSLNLMYFYYAAHCFGWPCERSKSNTCCGECSSQE